MTPWSVGATKNWFIKNERSVSTAFLIGGFILDTLTLKRIDSLWENLWIAFHLLVVAVVIVLLHYKEKKVGADKSGTHFWLINILQLFFGGLMSAFLVFYFRAATLSATWPFILILVVAILANEFLKKHYARLIFQTSFLFISIFLFAIFEVPIVLNRIGAPIFIVSGAISLIIISAFFSLLKGVIGPEFKKNRITLRTAISLIFIVINVLYFTNLIPPLPLSLKSAGIYHLVTRDDAGNYVAEYEDLGWEGFFKIYKDFHLAPGSPVYAYSAIFAPSDINLNVVHEWQYLDEESDMWVDKSRIPLPVVGGRDGGFRTYSVGYDLQSGRWRLNVETQNGQVIGRLFFNIIHVDEVPALKNSQNL